MNETQSLARADAADAILQHPLIDEALTDYQERLIEAWRNSKARAHQEREELHRMLQASEHFRAYLTRVVTKGKMIRAQVRKPSMAQRVLNKFRGAQV